MSSVAPLKSVTILLSDSLLKDFRCHSSKGEDSLVSLYKSGGTYRDRTLALPYCGLHGLDEQVVQAIFGGWDVVREDFSSFHAEQLAKVLGDGGVTRNQVKRVILVLGINSIRGFLSNKTKPRGLEEESSLVYQTAVHITAVMLHLLIRWFPSAEVLYLGTGQVYQTPCGRLGKIDPAALAQVNNMGREVQSRVHFLCTNWAGRLAEWEKEGLQELVLSFRSCKGRLLVLEGAWDGWSNAHVADEFGHLSRLGVTAFRNFLGAKLGDLNKVSLNLKRKEKEVKELLAELNAFASTATVSARSAPEPFPEQDAEEASLQLGSAGEEAGSSGDEPMEVVTIDDQ